MADLAGKLYYKTPQNFITINTVNLDTLATPEANLPSKPETDTAKSTVVSQPGFPTRRPALISSYTPRAGPSQSVSISIPSRSSSENLCRTGCRARFASGLPPMAMKFTVNQRPPQTRHWKYCNRKTRSGSLTAITKTACRISIWCGNAVLSIRFPVVKKGLLFGIRKRLLSSVSGLVCAIGGLWWSRTGDRLDAVRWSRTWVQKRSSNFTISLKITQATRI